MENFMAPARMAMPRMALGAGDTICSTVPDCSVSIGEALKLELIESSISVGDK